MKSLIKKADFSPRIFPRFFEGGWLAQKHHTALPRITVSLLRGLRFVTRSRAGSDMVGGDCFVWIHPGREEIEITLISPAFIKDSAPFGL